MTDFATADQEIICRTCKKPFIFSAEKQAQFKAKGYQPPKDCYYCGQEKKRQREAANGAPMSRPTSPRPSSPAPRREDAATVNFGRIYGVSASDAPGHDNGRKKNWKQDNGGGGQKRRGHGSDRRRRTDDDYGDVWR